MCGGKHCGGGYLCYRGVCSSRLLVWGVQTLQGGASASEGSIDLSEERRAWPGGGRIIARTIIWAATTTGGGWSLESEE